MDHYAIIEGHCPEPLLEAVRALLDGTKSRTRDDLPALSGCIGAHGTGRHLARPRIGQYKSGWA